MPRPRAHVRSSAGPPPAPSLVRARCAPSSTPMPERRPEARLPARTAPGSSESGSRHRTPRCRPCCRSQTDHSTTLRSNTPPEWVVWCSFAQARSSWSSSCRVRQYGQSAGHGVIVLVAPNTPYGIRTQSGASPHWFVNNCPGVGTQVYALSLMRGIPRAMLCSRRMSLCGISSGSANIPR